MSIPFFVIGFTCVWVLMLISFTGETFAIALGCIAMVLFLISLFARKDKTLLCVTLTCVLACSSFVLKTEIYYKPSLEFVDKTCAISGKVISVESKSDSGAYRCVVKVDEGDLKGYKIRLSSKSYEGNLNDYVSFTAKVYSIDYLKHRDIYLGCYTYEEIEGVHDDGFSLRMLAQNIRNYLENELKENLPKDCSLTLLGMLIGDKSELPDEVYESFQKSGIVHLLAVSGFHTSLWSMIVYRQLLKRGINMKVSAIVSIVFILAFMGLTGFSKSTVRAGLMLIVFFFGRVLSRQPDSKNSLGFAATIIMLLNPFSGGDVGFLLSFFSTLGILVVFPVLQKQMRGVLKKKVNNFYVRQRVDDVLSVVLITVSTYALTLPLIMLLIGDISLVSPISNLLVTSFASGAIFLSGVAVVVSKIPIFNAFEHPLLLVSGLIVKYVLYVSNLLSSFGFATADISVNFVKVAVAAVIILVAFSLILKLPKKQTTIAGTVLFVFSIAAHYLVEYIELTYKL